MYASCQSDSMVTNMANGIILLENNLNVTLFYRNSIQGPTAEMVNIKILTLSFEIVL